MSPLGAPGNQGFTVSSGLSLPDFHGAGRNPGFEENAGKGHRLSVKVPKGPGEAGRAGLSSILARDEGEGGERRRGKTAFRA